ncbi:MAG TPA: hypothetical protein VMW56_22270 [Candidatus Margulisiibacteriota bacterium]|nr:hypothetical protein [Candidatus Margulisiibacteriota bacterium]
MQALVSARRDAIGLERTAQRGQTLGSPHSTQPRLDVEQRGGEP